MRHHVKIKILKKYTRSGFKFVGARISVGNKAKSLVCIILLIILVIMNSRITQTAENSDVQLRPDHWASPLEFDGLPNFHKVTDALYRGAQPTAEGMRQLKKLGVKTVINLRSLHSDKDEIGDLDLAYEHIRMIWHPNKEEVVQFLQIVSDRKRAPVFVHCMHGADRTGVMCAIYRVAICGWTKQEAISEMTMGGFGYHKIWSNLIRFVEDLDISEIKKRIKWKD